MKSETKAVVASLVVLALALSAVSGITYSWFSDTEEADVVITTGNVRLEVNCINPTVQSFGDTEPKLITADGVETTVGGNVKYSADSSAGATVGSSKMTITFDGAVPGDVIKFKLDVKLFNTINVNYKASLVKADDCPFIVDVRDGDGDSVTMGTTELVSKNDGATSTKSYTYDVTMTFPSGSTVSDVGTYTVAFVIQAVQSNVVPTDYVATKTIKPGTTTAQTITVQSNEASSKIDVTIPASVTGESGAALDKSISVTAKAMGSIEGSTVAASSGSFLSGVEVTTSQTIKPGSGSYFEIQMNVGALTDAQVAALKVFHKDAEVPKDTPSATGGEYYAYASGLVTIYALSFSPFVVVDGCQASIGSEKYETLVSAVDAVKGGQTITLLRDCDGAGIFVADGAKSFDIDFNGFTYTVSKDPVGSEGTENQAFHLEKDNDFRFYNGTIACTDGSGVKLLVQNYSNLTLEDMVLDGSKLMSGGYTWSNNNGDSIVTGNTKIVAPSDGYAFDVYYKFSSYESVSVTFDDGFTGSVEGKIQFVIAPKTDFADWKENAKLIIRGNGDFSKATWDVYPGANIESPTKVANTGKIVLPEGITEASFTDGNTVYDGKSFYKTMKDALSKMNEGISEIWCKPGADVGFGSHLHVCKNLTIYGNGAFISGGEIFEVDMYNFAGEVGSDLSGEITLAIHSLNGSSVWGGRHSEYTINIEIDDCLNMSAVYITDVTGVNNITIDGCTFSSDSHTAVYSNAAGAVSVKDTTFDSYALGMNLNNKSGTSQNITIENCVFVNCATNKNVKWDTTDWSAFAAPIRIVASESGSKSNVTMDGCSFVYSDGQSAVKGNILYGDDQPGKEINGTVFVNGVEVTQLKPESD